MWKTMFILLLVGGMVITGCQSTSLDAATPAKLEPSQATIKIPERIQPIEATMPVSGEVPTHILDSILKDLGKRIGASLEQIIVIQAQAVVWNDGSLGCPQPGMMYTQALVNGYRVILMDGDQKYDYHISQSGYFTLCENGLTVIPPIETIPSQ
jgi:hypothetical protein